SRRRADDLVSACSPVLVLGTNRHSSAALPAQMRAHIPGTLAAGGGWTLIPTQGGDEAGRGSRWSYARKGERQSSAVPRRGWGRRGTRRMAATARTAWCSRGVVKCENARPDGRVRSLR